MTHLAIDVRFMAFKFFDLVVQNYPPAFFTYAEKPGLRSIWEKYYEDAHAVIHVLNANAPSRFKDSKSALEKVLRHQDWQGVPLVILANKQCPRQALGSKDCGYYVCRYMIETIESRRQLIPDKGS
ncbi:hypothetical protein BVRB_6g134590 isoform C [Beta vulgaris subsp. vulgaris]|nr:hypothetical protein BVRB_6g134590 isoform C [Beta vulgaris subsp. vulgaris]